MRTKISIILILAAALALTACAPTNITQQAAPTVRTINVSGLGQSTLTPDIAYINIGVHNEAPAATDAVAANKTKTSAVIKALKAAGLADKDIQTTNFSIWPNQQYAQDGTSTGVIYAVDNTVYVVVRNLDGLGDLLDSAITAGANSINSIQFDVADKTDALKKARQSAVKDAQTQAQELADAAAVKLGAIQSISFFDNSPIPMAAGKGGGGASADVAVPIQPGQLTISISVNIVYEIK